LGGALKVSLANGFEPRVGDKFSVLTFPSSMGAFDTIHLPQTNRYGWEVAYSNTAVTLTVLSDIAPTATTQAASDITSADATLHGSVNPSGVPTVAWFEYGLTPAYGSRTVAADVGSGLGAVAFQQAITGLLPGTNYHYRVVATNQGGMALGADLVFQTAAPVTPPVISAHELLGTGQFRLRFDSTPGTSFSVLVSTNLADWNPLGPAVELTPGHFEFTDPEAPGHPTRFYRLRTP
jgi:hypothetical protein